MKRLYLLRHAQAATPQGVDDIHRPLSHTGTGQALAMGMHMRDKGYIPDVCICSPARRTQQTMRKLFESIGERPFVSPRSAYYTSVGQLYELIQAAPDRAQSVLLISHNPSIHALARWLVGIGEAKQVERLSAGYSECTLTVLQCSLEHWSELKPDYNDLIDLVVPGEDFKV